MRVIIVVIDIKLPNGTITQKSFHFPAEKKSLDAPRRLARNANFRPYWADERRIIFFIFQNLIESRREKWKASLKHI
jgi:hypothetical protein